MIFCTFEDTEAHYNGSGWVGGNVFNAGTGKYRLGTDFPQQQFMHLVYNAGILRVDGGRRGDSVRPVRRLGLRHQRHDPEPVGHHPGMGFQP